MSLDIERIKERMNTLKSNGQRKNAFWRPPDGKSVIRIVPTADGDPFKDYWFHYNVGKNPGFLSPKKNFGDDCPLDAFVRKLFNEGSEESIKMAKNLMARQRFFAPVVVRGEEDQGVRVWGFGKQVYEKLLNLVLNPEYGDITDVDEGIDLTLQYGKPAGAQFPQTELTPRRHASPLHEDSERCTEYLENIPDFDSLFERKSSGEVQVLLDEYLLGEEDAEEVSTETTKYKSSEKASEVDSAFEELMG